MYSFLWSVMNFRRVACNLMPCWHQGSWTIPPMILNGKICGGSFEDVPIDLALGAQWPFGTWRVSLQWGEAWLLKSEADLKDQPDFDGLFQKPACSIRSPLGTHCMPIMHNYAGKHADLNAYIVRCLFVWVMSLRFRTEYDLSSPWSHKSNMEFPKMGVPPIIQVMDDHFSTETHGDRGFPHLWTPHKNSNPSHTPRSRWPWCICSTQRPCCTWGSSRDMEYRQSGGVQMGEETAKLRRMNHCNFILERRINRQAPFWEFVSPESIDAVGVPTGLTKTYG